MEKPGQQHSDLKRRRIIARGAPAAFVNPSPAVGGVEYGGLRHCVMQPSRGCNDSKAGAGGAGATAAPAPAADRNSCRKENYSSSLSPLSSSSLAAVACQRTVDLRTRFRPENLSLTFVTEVHRPNSPNLLFAYNCSL
ncbi:hypothetical protein HZH68_014110 [Vespula germanica]|uniref:Uncharacterized protein n=1 Tax=Vespula germanica TaxID=30212 RepID=A0A834MVI0_VESGE|nr:hypothetical protein HZH68_014110 [Vespula germanica]